MTVLFCTPPKKKIKQAHHLRSSEMYIPSCRLRMHFKGWRLGGKQCKSLCSAAFSDCIADGVYHSIEILDTAGLHQFPAMKKLRIEAGEAFVIVYSIDSLQSYHNAAQLMQEVEDIKLGERQS